MKRIIVTLGLVMLMPLAALAFTDVNSSTDYKEAIDWMHDNGVIEGYSDGTFRPNDCVNRAEFLKMAFEVVDFDYDFDFGEIFPDVERSDWFYAPVMAAQVLSVVEGYPDGYFRPSQCVNRVEAIKMAESLLISDILYPNYNAGVGYADVKSDAWYYPYLKAALDYDFVGLEHVSGGKFYPNGEMSRKEVAELLYRIVQFQEDSQADAMVAATQDSAQPYIGNSDAPVLIVAFYDYECPFCRMYEENTFPLIKENYIDTGKVQYMFKDFPLPSHPNADDAAIAATCAYALGGNTTFYGYHRDLFAANSLNYDLYLDLAVDNNIDVDDFEICYETYVAEMEVLNDIDAGKKLGVSGTPSFIVNGEIINGAQPFEVFESAIEDALN